MTKKMIVSFILDETGSMQSVKEQTINGFNEYIKTLKSEKSASDIQFAMTKFNSERVEIVYDGVNLKEVQPLNQDTYHPRALTPLYDAIGRSIGALEKKVNSKKKQNVLMVIQTDGHENHSKEFSRNGIFNLIDEKKKAGWTFAFLGADQDAWLAGQKLGLDKGNVISYDSKQTESVFANLAQSTSRYAKGGGTQTKTFFSEDEES